jgi:hypothetical protein
MIARRRGVTCAAISSKLAPGQQFPVWKNREEKI